ncbi:MAG TPA: hydrogenase [Casimicrobiaceae bacterium]|jgi:hydrogenase-1 operon protein HyaE
MTTATTFGSAPAGLHPLIGQLFAKHGCTEVDVDTFDAFAQQPGHALVLFTEDPLRIRETLDLAVIVPELAQAFRGCFRVGVLLPVAARQLQARYGFRRWPAFVILRDGAYVGAVEGLRNWDEYVQEVGQLLEAAPARPPTIGIPVKTAGTDAAGCGS